MQFDIRAYDHLSSSQDQLKTLVRSGESSEGLVVHAHTQDAGRGRRGRDWLSPEGNLYLSVLLKPNCAVERIGELGFVVSLAIGRYLMSLGITQERLILKWPNDVLIDGKKCAGILLEYEEGSLFAGIGLNIVSAPLDTAISLKQAGFKDVQMNNVRDDLLSHLAKTYQQWQEEGFRGIRLQWLNLSHGLGIILKISQGKEVIEGVFQGLDEDGHLLLRSKQNKTLKISSGDIIEGC